MRKVGIDDTQDLFEGLIESALGAIAGSSALMAADGSVYYARKTYEDARQRMLLRGVTAEEIELYKNNMMELLKSKPDAFGKVLNYVLERNLQRMSEGETIAQGGADAENATVAAKRQTEAWRRYAKMSRGFAVCLTKYTNVRLKLPETQGKRELPPA